METATSRNKAPLNRRIRGVPLRYVVPNLVTLLGVCAGLTAMRFAIEARFDYAVMAVLAAAVLDGLDGRIARALKGSSRFGAELDSLADFLDFGVAPGFILYLWGLQQMKGGGWIAVMLFAIAGALRLARFNVMHDDPCRPDWAGRFFTGMPAPAGAICALLPIYVHFVLDLPPMRAEMPFVIAYELFIAVLMASAIPHFSGKFVARIPRDRFGVYLLLLIGALTLVATFPMEMLIAVTLIYLATIPFAMRSYHRLRRADAIAAARE